MAQASPLDGSRPRRIDIGENIHIDVLFEDDQVLYKLWNAHQRITLGNNEIAWMFKNRGLLLDISRIINLLTLSRTDKELIEHYKMRQSTFPELFPICEPNIGCMRPISVSDTTCIAVTKHCMETQFHITTYGWQTMTLSEREMRIFFTKEEEMQITERLVKEIEFLKGVLEIRKMTVRLDRLFPDHCDSLVEENLRETDQ